MTLQMFTPGTLVKLFNDTYSWIAPTWDGAHIEGHYFTSLDLLIVVACVDGLSYNNDYTIKWHLVMSPRTGKLGWYPSEEAHLEEIE